MAGSYLSARALVNAGADVNLRNNEGSSAVREAKMNGHGLVRPAACFSVLGSRLWRDGEQGWCALRVLLGPDQRVRSRITGSDMRSQKGVACGGVNE